jgi:hypothetical protein
MDIRLSEFENLVMEQAHKAVKCPQCGSLMTLASGRGKELRLLRCEQCKGLDPLKAREVIGWLKGELQPPK